MDKYALVLLAIIGGVAMGFQTPVNNALSRFTGIVQASCISFTVGALSLFILSMIVGQGSILKFTQAPWYLLIGGLLGATLVTINIFVIPKIGSLAVIGSVITGQMVAGLVIDQVGLLGLAQHPITWTRILGLVLMIAGLRFILVK